jgi:eukaryotic-like serine/threonine-protein kinase
MKTISATVIVLLVLALFLAPVAASDWPGAKKDVTHTSYADEALNPPLQLSWSKNVGGSIAASPVIADGVLYYTNDTGSTLLAVNLTSGSVIFKSGLAGSLESTPTVTTDAIILGSYDGNVYSLRKSDGGISWKTQLEGGMFSSPLVDYGRVYIGTDTGAFYALDQATGAIVWTRPGNMTQGTPAGDDDKVFIGMLDGNVYALDPGTGRTIWAFDTNDSVHSSPMIYDGKVYIASRDGKLYALDEKTGVPAWTADLGYKTDATPSLDPASGTVFIGTFGGYMRAVNASTGDTRWISQFYGPIYATAAVAGDTVYCNTQDGELFALDTANGAERWTYDLGGEAWASPAIAGGRLVTGTNSGELLVFSAASGPTVTPSPAPTTSATNATTTPFPGMAICVFALVSGAVLYLRRR